MKITIYGKQMSVRDSLKAAIERKLMKFNKFFGEETEAAVTCNTRKCLIIWFEYLRSHRSIHLIKVCVWGIIAPIIMSGIIELMQAYCTESRSGEWLDFYANSLGAVIAALIGFNLLRPWIWKK